MQGVDAELARRGLAIFQRPLHVPMLLWEAFGWGGNALPGRSLADLPGYGHDVILAKAYRWYDETFGSENLKAANFSHGSFAIRLGSAVWRVRLPLIFGTVHFFADRNLANTGTMIGKRGPATSNALKHIEKITEGVATRLVDADITRFMEQFVMAIRAFQWHEGLPSSELFQTSRNDSASATDELIARRYGQARWASQQALEKTIKGALTLAGTTFPTSGRDGHDLVALAGLLEKHHSVSIPENFLKDCACSPAVRYGEEESTEDQALLANQAIVQSFHAMRTSPGMERVLAAANAARL
jgi:HEPN domain-containing protein